MRFREIMEMRFNHLDVSDEAIEKELFRLLGPDMPDDVRAQIVDAFWRDPPPRMTPAEMEAMYGVEDDDRPEDLIKANLEVARLRAQLEKERLANRKICAQIAKIKADTRAVEQRKTNRKS